MINILEIKFDNEGNVTSDFSDRDVPQFSHNVQEIRMFIPKEIFDDTSVVNISFENDDEVVMIDGLCYAIADNDLDYRIYGFKLTKYYTQYLGLLRLQASVNNMVDGVSTNVWTSFKFNLNVRRGVKGQSVVIDDPDVALQLQAEIDKLSLNKQNNISADLGSQYDNGFDLNSIYSFFKITNTGAVRVYYRKNSGKNGMTAALGLDDFIVDNEAWTIHFVYVNGDNDFRLMVLFKNDKNTINLAKELISTNGQDLKDTGWVDLNYLSILKERDIQHDEAINKNVQDIKDLQGALSYNNIGLLWVSKYDEKTGNITYILNPDFRYEIDDSKLESEGTIDWYVNPRNTEVNNNE